MLYYSWNMVHDVCNCYFSFWAIFCPFTPVTPKKWKNEKVKKVPGEIIILHKCTKNHDHIPYSSRDMMRDVCNCYFSLWANFCPFTPVTPPPKWKFQKMKKIAWRYHHFAQVYRKSWSYAILFLKYGTWRM